MQVVEPRADHALHRIRQRERALATLEHRLVVAARERLLFEQRGAHLFEEEWVAARAIVQPLRERVGHSANAQDRLHDGDGRREIQPLEMNPRRLCRPLSWGAVGDS
jgi:hypothetical protein